MALIALKIVRHVSGLSLVSSRTELEHFIHRFKDGRDNLVRSFSVLDSLLEARKSFLDRIH